jgi:hypothetical protein
MEGEGICTEAATKSAKSWPKRAKPSKRLALSPALPKAIRCLGVADFDTAYKNNTVTSKSLAYDLLGLNCCRMMLLQKVLHVAHDMHNL